MARPRGLPGVIANRAEGEGETLAADEAAGEAAAAVSGEDSGWPSGRESWNSGCSYVCHECRMQARTREIPTDVMWA
jgi:hypothetical protein